MKVKYIVTIEDKDIAKTNYIEPTIDVYNTYFNKTINVIS
jgi:hypothetical protein